MGLLVAVGACVKGGKAPWRLPADGALPGRVRCIRLWSAVGGLFAEAWPEEKVCQASENDVPAVCALGVVVDERCLPGCRSSVVLLSLMYPAWVAQEAGQPGRHLARGLV